MSDKSKQRDLPPGAAKGAIRDNLEVICSAMALILFFKTFVGQQFTIPTGSMRSTLMIGDHLLINKFVFAVPQWDWEAKLFPMRKVEKGDIIVFRYPLQREEDYVKRCVALPGDVVEVKEKRLFVNGKQVTGPFEHHILNLEEGPLAGPWPASRPAGGGEDIPEGMIPASLWRWADPMEVTRSQQGKDMLPGGFRDNLGPITVPKGHLFAMGDNRDQSADSRYWGFVPIDHLRGRPFMVWWSFREGGKDDQRAKVAEHPGDVLMNFVDGARHFFVWSRWERTGYIPR